MVHGTLVENAITAAFLADERGPARSVDTGQPAFAGTRAWLGRPVLNRPAFLGADTVRDLDHDLGVVFDVLSSLPDRLFGGDHGALARALGLPEAQVEAVTRYSPRTPPVRLGRADLLLDDSVFRLAEFNSSSSLGGCEVGDMNRAMLADEAFRTFAEHAGLTYLDPVEGIMRSQAGFAGSASPHPLAVVKWPNSPETANDFAHMALFLRRLGELGYEPVPCPISALSYRDGALFAAGRRVEHVFRTFQLGRLTGSAESQELAAPLLAAVADGAATLFAPFSADLYGAKECLAMVSDEYNRSAFTADELSVLDRVLPWTRSLRDTSTTLDGSRVDLLTHVLANRSDLVLKPSVGYAGQGVIAGWLVDQSEWERAVRAAALTGPTHVVQRRMTETAERFVDNDDPNVLAPCLLSWGAFYGADGYSGAFVKGIPGTEQAIRFLGDGSHVGCVFHEAARP
jgi:hypothetical protein